MDDLDSTYLNLRRKEREEKQIIERLSKSAVVASLQIKTANEMMRELENIAYQLGYRINHETGELVKF